MSRSDRDLTYVAPVFRVADIKRSLAYYRDRLGFEVEFVHEGFYAGVIQDGCRIHFKCAGSVERDQAAFVAAEHLDACIGVRDAQGLAAQFATNGADFLVRLRVMPYGKEFTIRDPDEYILGFVQSGAAQTSAESAQQRSSAMSESTSTVENKSLAGAQFSNVNLSVSRFDDVNLRRAGFINVALAGATFKDVSFANASIEDSNLDGMRIDGVLVSELFLAYRRRATENPQ